MDADCQSYLAFEAGAGIEAGSGRPDTGGLLRQYVAENYNHLHRRLRYRLGCPDLARDCLHDTWLRLGEITLPARVQYPDAYVYRMACNLAVDRLRGERPCISWAELDDADEMRDPAPTPEQVAEARSELAQLDRAFQQLPYRHRLVLFDLRVEEQTRAAVAARYGLSTRRIDTVLRQSLDHCAARMQRNRAAA